MSKDCPNCGNEIEMDSKFCDNCGAEIKDEPNAAGEEAFTQKNKIPLIIIGATALIVIMLWQFLRQQYLTVLFSSLNESQRKALTLMAFTLKSHRNSDLIRHP